MDYPILVEKYKEDQATRVICTRCEREYTDWDPADGDPYDLCSKCDSCEGDLMFKYEQADCCRGCGELGFYEKILDHCCSRVCQLQAEYLVSLRTEKNG